MEAQKVFNVSGINITTEGKKYLGGFIGTEEGKEEYVKGLIEDWIDQIN